MNCYGIMWKILRKMKRNRGFGMGVKSIILKEMNMERIRTLQNHKIKLREEINSNIYEENEELILGMKIRYKEKTYYIDLDENVVKGVI